MTGQKPANSWIVERLISRQEDNPSKRVITFVAEKSGGIVEKGHVTYDTLLQSAFGIASYIRTKGNLQPGDRVLLVFSPGLEMYKAFLACQAGGFIPVPVSPPHPSKLEADLPKLNKIVEGSGSKLVLTNSEYHQVYAMDRSLLGRLMRSSKRVDWPTIPWHVVEQIEARMHKATDFSVFDLPTATQDAKGNWSDNAQIAFVQYTSGSTGHPKGVVVTYGNLRHQMAEAHRELDMDEQSTFCSWMPHYHDFGLIIAFLATITAGAHLVVCSPLDFIKRPVIWLEMITKYGGTHTASPDFGYNLVTRKTTPKDREKLKLHTMKFSLSGAEPIQYCTMSAFYKAFELAGYKPSMFCGCFGMAEHVAGVTVHGRNVLHVDRAELDNKGWARVLGSATASSRTLMSSGYPMRLAHLEIVDPNTLQALPEHQVGEVWLNSPSKTAGYYNQPELTTTAFHARLANSESKEEFLRTGDLGFVHGGQLYICGRLKDMIIVHGRNIYPNDVEDCVREAHAAVRPGGVAVFGIQVTMDGAASEEESLVVFVEIEKSRESNANLELLKEMVGAIRSEIMQAFWLQPHAVVVLRPGAVMKTTSGKVSRSACKEAFLAGKLQSDKSKVLHFDVAEVQQLNLTLSYKGPEEQPAGPTPGLPESKVTMQRYPSWTPDWANAAALASLPSGQSRALAPRHSIGPLQGLPALPDPQPPVTGHSLGAGSNPLATVSSVTPMRKAGGSTGVMNTFLAQLVRLPDKEKLSFAEETILKVLRAAMGSRAVELDTHTPFMAMGLASVQAAEVSSQIGEAIGLQLSPIVVFERPNVRKLAKYILELLVMEGAIQKQQMALSQLESINSVLPGAGGPVLAGRGTEIAIVGMACRFPGASSVDEYWQLLCGGEDAVGPVPPGRWNTSGMDVMSMLSKEQQAAIQRGGFIKNADKFDAAFFNISDAEARAMDPQQRLLLEVSYEALHAAGLERDALQDSNTGVFVGISSFDFMAMKLRGPAQSTPYLSTGLAHSAAAGRISYALGLTGPSVSLDTACSSSLVALHHACSSLLLQECSAAVVAGVNLLLDPTTSAYIAAAGMLSPDGRCKFGDASANGYVRGEGCGAVVVKLLANAIADGDEVLAVVRGSAVRSDGASATFVAPSVLAQQELINTVLAKAKVEPKQVSYLEAHGTGTALGDPIEMQAVRNVLGLDRPEDNPLVVGAVKTNIAHLEAAAGMAGLIKTVLVLRKRAAPANLHLQQINPVVQQVLGTMPFIFPRQLMSLDGVAPRNKKLLAGVSSFGFTGTIAHVLLEEATASRGFTKGKQDNKPNVKAGFVFGDAASHFAGMGKELFHSEPVYKAAILEVEQRTQSIFKVPLTTILYPDEQVGDCDETSALLAILERKPRYIAAAVFAVQYALAKLCIDRGILPAVVAGAGLGEYVAAALAGVMSTADAVQLAVEHVNALAEGGPSPEEARLQRFKEMVQKVGFYDPELPFASSTDTTLSVSSQDYWLDLVRRPLDFKACLQSIVSTLGCSLLLGLSPRSILQQQGLQLDELEGGNRVTWVQAMEMGQDAGPYFKAAVAAANEALTEHTRVKFNQKNFPWVEEGGGYGSECKAIKASGRLAASRAVVHTVCWNQLPATPATTHRLPQGSRALVLQLGVSPAATLLVDALTLQLGGTTVRASIPEDVESALAVAGTTHLLVMAAAGSGVQEQQDVLLMLMRLFQSLARPRDSSGRTPPLLVLIATVGAQLLPDSASVPAAAPGPAAVWGFARVGRREMPHLRIACVDLDSRASEDATTSAAFIAEELASGLPNAEVVWSGGARHTPSITWLESSGKPPAAASTQLPPGAYIISGGLGGLGLATASALADLGATTLVLVSRSGAVAHADQGLEVQLEQLQRRPGVSVQLVKCDVCDAAAVAQMAAEARSQGIPLRGVVHAAGVLADALIVNQNQQQLATVFSVKAAGAWHLHQATLQDELSLFLLYSSIAAEVGSPGQANYAAANAYLDGLAAWRRSESLQGLSVQWSPISDAGMLAGISSLRESEPHAAASISTQAAMHVLRELLTSPQPSPVLAVLPGRLDAALRQLPTGFTLASVDIEAVIAGLARPSMGATGHVLAAQYPGQQLQEHVLSVTVGVVADLIGMDAAQLDLDVPLLELGLDSLGTAEAISQLRKRLQLPELSVTVLFKHPTLRALAGHLVECMRPAEAVLPAAVGRTVAPKGHSDMAVVSMACRFPGQADSPQAFWDNLMSGRDGVGMVPKERWDPAALDTTALNDSARAALRHGAFIEGVELFDNAIFGISAAEASAMDPAHRLLLEVSFEALHSAGYTKQSLLGANIGVFVGIGSSDFASIKLHNGELTSAYAGTGVGHSAAAGRISYTLGLTGPCLAVDTACSSSLVALHQACRALEHGECDAALVAGVNLLLHPQPFLTTAVAGMLSPDGRCKFGDASANGYVRAEGCGVVLLKRLQDAVTSGDSVLALVAGCAVRQDGRSASFTAPSGSAQAELMQQALVEASVEPASVAYLEAHGTGTALGDPIEMEAAAGVLGKGRAADRPLVVGAVKSSVGHLEAAAGIAGLIKAVLVLQHRTVPPNLHLKELNPLVANAVAGLPLLFPQEATALAEDHGEVVAGLSSFGFTGTIAHAVLKSYPAPMTALPAKGARPKVAFLMTGQGAQYPDMGRELFEQEPVFRDALQQCNDLLLPHLPLPLLAVMFPGSTGTDPALINQTQYAQPALFALEYALAQLWKARGVEPDMLMGHSLGEYVAATLAGVFSLADSLRLIAARARLVQSLPPGGGMVAVRCSGEEATEALANCSREDAMLVSIAAVNGPCSVVLSGEAAAVERVAQLVGKSYKRLEVSHALHSALLDPILPAFEAELKQVAMSPPKIALVSNVTGSLAGPEVSTTAYWLYHLRKSVHFLEGMLTLEAEGCQLFVEVGPHPTLTKMGQACVSAGRHTFRPSLTKGEDSKACMEGAVTSVLRMLASGARVQFNRKPFAWRSVTMPPASAQSVAKVPEPALSSAFVHTLQWQTCSAVPAIAASLPAGSKVLLINLCSGSAPLLLAALHQSLAAPTERMQAETPQGLADTLSASSYTHIIALAVTQGPAAAELDSLQLLMALLQAVAASKQAAKVVVVTEGVQPVPDRGPQGTAETALGSSLHGFVRSVRREVPELQIVCVDLDCDENPAAAAQQVSAEVAALTASDPTTYERDIAVRLGGQRYAARLSPCLRELPLTSPTDAAASGRLPSGAYIITGGLGALGLAVAGALADMGADTLVLVSRSGTVAHTGQGLEAQLEQLQQRPGLTVQLKSCDVGSMAAVGQLVGEVRTQFGAVRGVVHAAGVLRDASLGSQSESTLRSVYAPKAGGAWNLHMATLEDDLALFVMFSSFASLFGSASQANYSAANAFLDHLAARRCGRGLPGLSIQWPAIAGAGMAAALGTQLHSMPAIMTQQHVAAVFRQLCDPTAAAAQAPLSVMAVSVIPAGRLLGLLPRGEPLMQLLKPAGTASASDSVLWSESAVQHVEAVLLEEARAVCGTGEVMVPETSLVGAGMDSLAIGEFASRVQVRLGIRLPPHILFQQPTVADLMQYIVREQEPPATATGGAQRMIEEGSGDPFFPMVPAAAAPPGACKIQARLSVEEKAAGVRCSHQQVQLYTAWKLDPGVDAYNLVHALRVTGELDAHALRLAMDLLIKRHEVLRTHFKAGGPASEPLQVVTPADQCGVVWRCVDLTDQDTVDTSRILQESGSSHSRHSSFSGHPSTISATAELSGTALQLLQEEAARPFDLHEGPLLRILVLQIAQQDAVFMLCVHHIVLDGWSMALIIREISATYNALTGHQALHLPAIPAQFSDYAANQRDEQTGNVERHLAYWKQQLHGAPTLLELPLDHPRPAVAGNHGKQVPLRVDEATGKRLRSLAKDCHVTSFTVMLAAVKVLLMRYSRQDDIVVGTPYAGRADAELSTLVGYLVNPLALRTDLSGDPTFRELLQRVQGNVAGAFSHSEAPFQHVVAGAGLERNPSYNPLFQVMLALQDARWMCTFDFAGTASQVLDSLTSNGPSFDLVFDLLEVGNAIEGHLVYRPEIFNRTTIERMALHLTELLSAIAQKPESPLSQLSFLTLEEREMLLTTFNATSQPYPESPPVHQAFEAQAQANPSAVCLVYEGATMTYQQLNEEANQLAHFLISLGVNSDTPVGLLMERSMSMVVGMLGILKAGGCYVPMDPDHPKERLAGMLEDAAVPVLLTTQPQLARSGLDVARCTTVLLDTQWSASIGSQPTTNPGPRASPSSLVYIIFTSGSTGRPKGVMVEHHSLSNKLHFMQQRYRLDSSDCFLQKYAISFDASVHELMPPLWVGGRLVLARPGGQKDAAYLAKLVMQHGVTNAEFVPLQLPVLIQELAASARTLKLKRISTGGDALLPALAAEFLTTFPSVELHNVYGPTEATVSVTDFTCKLPLAAATVPIGQPVANAKLLALDSQRQLCAVGVPGELHISGPCLARGYINKPDMTADKFVSNPHAGGEGYERMYRTGDLVRWLPDGNLEFLGRIDLQVKLRGFRIELGEVEACISQVPPVREAAVVLLVDPAGEKQMVAYITPQHVDCEVLAAMLRGKLPEHMVPAIIVALEELPVLPSGKIDRRSLPQPDWGVGAGSVDDFVPASSKVEEAVQTAVQELLCCKAASMTADFFRLGGNSLQAGVLAATLKKQLGVDVPVMLVFQHRTLRALAAELQKSVGAATLSLAAFRTASLIPRATEKDKLLGLPTSAQQVQMYTLHRATPQSSAYNMVSALQLLGPLDARALSDAISLLMCRHDSLRTVFMLSPSSGLLQMVRPRDHSFLLPVVEPSDPEELARMLRDSALRPFDLDRGPVFRCKLYRQGPQQHVLMLAVHHAVADGWSMAILHGELAAAYNALAAGRAPELPIASVQYADYAVWQQSQQARWEQQLGHWRQQLQGAPELLQLTTDKIRPAVPSGEGARVSVTIPGRLGEKLRQLAQQADCTLFMVLLAAFQLLLGRYTQQQDIVVGTPYAGRSRAETHGIVGYFVQTLALRTSLAPEPGHSSVDFLGLLARVRHTFLMALDNADVPFQHLVEALCSSRVGSHNPLFQAMFALQDSRWGSIPQFEGVQVQPVRHQLSGGSKVDLMLDLQEQGGEAALHGHLEYSTDLFEEQTIRRFAGNLQALLESIVASPGAPISHLSILPDVDRQQLLETFNTTAQPVPWGSKSLVQLFQEHVAACPDTPCLIHEGKTLSFAQVAKHATQLAHYLVGLGVGRDVPVGLLLPRGPDQVISLVAVMLAGGVYVPLDPEYPPDRLAIYMEDTAAPVLITDSSLSGLLSSMPSACKHVVRLDTVQQQLQALPQEPLGQRCGPTDLAYIIFTSGSTGRPKVVMVEHASLMNFLDYMRCTYDLTPADVVLQRTPLNFDPSIGEVFLPMAIGCSLVLPAHGSQKDPAYLAQLIRDSDVTLCRLVPSLLPYIVSQLAPHAAQLRLRDIPVGGEALPAAFVEECVQKLPNVNLWNVYGPAETTVEVTAWLCNAGTTAGQRSVPIGMPLQNCKLYVLDRNQQLVPIGIPGELYISGVCVARGYMGRPDLTAERFLPNPFATDADTARMYRTGDMVCWRSDGSLDYQGRADHQIKIRGMRVELGEIEAAVSNAGEVQQALATVQAAPSGADVLVVYVSPSSVDVDVLVEQLRAVLPEHMVPAAVVPLESFPLGPNGKVDRAKLPAPTWTSKAAKSQAGADSAQPPRETEVLLLGIWQQVLNVDGISTNDDYFALGGNSLQAGVIVGRVAEALGVQVPLVAVLQHRTIRQLARVIDELHPGRLTNEQEGPSPIQASNKNKGLARNPTRLRLKREASPRDPQTDGVPATLQQLAYYHLASASPVFRAQNIVKCVRIKGRMALPELKASLNTMAYRHEVLRAHFKEVKGVVMQFVSDPNVFRVPITEVDFSGSLILRQQHKIGQQLKAFSQQQMDLSHGPLFCVLLIKMSSKDHILCIVTHHIIMDGWSLAVLSDELVSVYNAVTAKEEPRLPLLPLTHADYAVWQNKFLQSSSLGPELQWWNNYLSGCPHNIPLPTDLPVALGALRTGKSGIVTVDIPAQLVTQLQLVARSGGATLSMLLLSAWALVLHKYSQQDDMVIVTPYADRHVPEMQGVIGCIANLLPVRAKLDGNPSFADLLQRVRDAALDAYAHADVPFAAVLESCTGITLKEALAGSPPLLQVMFAMQSESWAMGGLPLAGLDVEPLGLKPGPTPFELILNVWETSQGTVVGVLGYSSLLFKEATAVAMVSTLMDLLQKVAAQPKAAIEQLVLARRKGRFPTAGGWMAR